MSTHNVCPAVVWGGAVDCRYFLDNERFILAETGAPTKKLFVWDRWRNTLHVAGDYAPREGAPFDSRDLHPAWDRTGAYLAFDSTHSGQGWQARKAAPQLLQSSTICSSECSICHGCGPAGACSVLGT